MKRLSVLCALLAAAFACQAQTATPPEPPQVAAQPAAAEAPATPQEPEAVPEPEPEGAKLVIKDTKAGKGREAASGDVLRVHYTGWLYNFNARDGKGRKFDSSRDRGQPLELPIGAGRVIKGWDQGIVGMKVGGKRTLVIPPELGYGARTMGNGIIPANSTLLFEVELVGIK